MRVTRRRVAVALCAAPMLFLLVAGAAKLADLSYFLSAVARWHLLPAWSVVPITVLVPLAEISIALGWLLGLWARTSRAGAAGLLLAFTGVYALHLAAGDAPPCGCLGSSAAMRQLAGEGPVVIARNLVLLALLAAGWRLEAGPGRSGAGPGVARQTAAGGFTLLEVLVVIAVSAVVLSIALPALERTYGRSKRTASLANLRSHAQVFSLYTQEWRDAFPAFLDPRSARSSLAAPGGGEIELYYFMTHTAWNLALAEGYYVGNAMDRSFTPPEIPPDPSGAVAVLSGYFYSCAFAADPAYWDPRTRTGPSQWRGAHGREVNFPASKVLLSSSESGWGEAGGPVRAAFVDGSAREIAAGRIGPHYQGGEGGWPGAVHGVGPPAFMHTVSGAQGRDVLD